ncbi:mitochondrial S-adenosylmethionine carrier protein-like [Oscarella lobularis]|uniref:mitochondrial S-adenosylmethionine carrier protein-like n=1 Tax=Oscarella lobularis TaxID=121494 RepID=UPI003313D0F6
MRKQQPAPFWNPLIAGGAAGTAVDVALFPLDTIKTRLQSSRGFWGAGGFRGIYAGLASAAAGSAPGAATFFCTYESMKNALNPLVDPKRYFLVHMFAASVGEIVSCVVRVPVEIVKQRTQAGQYVTSYQALKGTLKSEGFGGLYRGYTTTVFREIPFSFIQYPVWEFLKAMWSQHQGKDVEPLQGAVCGSIAGGFSAAVTTPLDFAKTRIMLADKSSFEARSSIVAVILKVGRSEGVKKLFSGIVPRVTWISIGGFIYFGVYEAVRKFLQFST